MKTRSSPLLRLQSEQPTPWCSIPLSEVAEDLFTTSTHLRDSSLRRYELRNLYFDMLACTRNGAELAAGTDAVGSARGGFHSHRRFEKGCYVTTSI